MRSFLPIYPKSPDYHYLETFKAIRDVYNQLVEEVGANNIVMMGMVLVED